MSEEKSAESTEEKLDFKTILPVFVIVLVDLLGLTIIIPLLPLYAASYGASPAVIGALAAAYPVMQFIGAPILGRLSDRYGRRPVLIISQIGTFLGFILLGVANMLWMLFLSRLIDGLSGANIATAQAVIADRTTEKTRTQGLGLIGAAFGLGFIIGPVIAFTTLAASDNNYSLVAFVAAAFSLASIILTTVWLTESHPPEKRGKGDSKAAVGFRAMFAALQRPVIGFLLILTFAKQFSFGAVEQLLALFTLERLGFNGSSNAALFVFVGIVLVAVQGYFVGRWSKRFGDRWLVLMGLSVLSVGMLMTALTPRMTAPWYSRAELEAELTVETVNPEAADISVNIPDESNKGWLGIVWLFLAVIPLSIGGGVIQPAVSSLITQNVPPEEVGSILGIVTAFLSAASALSPLILGAIFGWLGSGAPYFIGAAIMGTFWLLSRSRIAS